MPDPILHNPRHRARQRRSLPFRAELRLPKQLGQHLPVGGQCCDVNGDLPPCRSVNFQLGTRMA